MDGRKGCPNYTKGKLSSIIHQGVRGEFSVSGSSDPRVIPCFTVSIHPMGFGLLIQCTDVMMPTLHMVFIPVINSIFFLRGFPDILFCFNNSPTFYFPPSM